MVGALKPFPADEDARLVQALRLGDEAAFATLLEQFHPSLVRVAMTHVRDRAIAEEVAQETWLGVIRGIHRFEGRSSLKTWIFRILTNTAKTRAIREGRSLPFTALGPEREEGGGPAVDPGRFLGRDHPGFPGQWASPPASWRGIPEQQVLSQETLGEIRNAIESLPPVQRQVITLRDVEGWSADEVCELLELSEANQRVLLHRARSKVRGALEEYFGEGAGTG
jgi:RNA polymerase sigma-70 factor, ECF subfamily